MAITVGKKFKVHKDLRAVFNGSVYLYSKGGYGDSSTGFNGFNTKGDHKGTFLLLEEEVQEYINSGQLVEQEKAGG